MSHFKKKTMIFKSIIVLSMILLNGGILLDAFVVAKTYQILDPIDGSNSTSSSTAAIITSDSYKDDNISIMIDTVNKYGVVYYVIDIQLSSVEYLKTAFAQNTFGKNITQTTTSIALANNAILAINGDYYGYRDSGLIIRNGVLYRDTPRSSPDDQALLITADGSFSLVEEGSVSGEDLVASGALQSLSFGPVLVNDGIIQSCSTKFVSTRANPRTALGMIAPLHYLIVIVDGRTSTSHGMTLLELAQVFVARGATLAYNLDGGGSSTLWFNGKIINNPTDGRTSGERKVSDILFIGA
jgi:hypothetical protein